MDSTSSSTYVTQSAGSKVLTSAPSLVPRAIVRANVLLLLLVSITAVAGLYVGNPVFAPMSLRAISNIATLCLLFSIITVSSVSRGGIWSASSMYLIVLGVFHFGLSAVYGAGMLSDDTAEVINSWFDARWTPYAIAVSTIGGLSCAMGIFVAQLIGPRRAARRSRFEGTEAPSLDRSLTIVGCLLVCGGALSWVFMVVRAGGFDLLFGSYRDYLELTAGELTGYAWLAIGFGVVFLAAAQPSRSQHAGFIAFGVISLIALPLGLRGEVLFAVVAGVVIRSRHRKPPTAAVTIVAIIVALFAISLLREVREVGLMNSVQLEQTSGNVLDGLTELGSSLRPAVEVIGWNEMGEDLIGGESYVAPFHRVGCKVIANLDCPPGDSDERNMSVLVTNRIGPIGFSPVAEAFRNFGVAGVVVVMGAVGAILGGLDRIKSNRSNSLIVGVIFLILLTNARGTFFVVPYSLALGAIAVAAVHIGAVLTANVSGKSARLET